MGLPTRTASWILRRHGVPYSRNCDSTTGQVIRSSSRTAVRYDDERTSKLVHTDVKKLGRIPKGGGRAAHRRAVAETIKHKQPARDDFVHSLVDDHSRLTYCEVLPDEKG